VLRTTRSCLGEFSWTGFRARMMNLRPNPSVRRSSAIGDFDCSPMSRPTHCDGSDDLGGQATASLLASAGAAAGITTDQRGVTRPQLNGCDIGAVEVTLADVLVESLAVQPKFTG